MIDKPRIEGHGGNQNLWVGAKSRPFLPRPGLAHL